MNFFRNIFFPAVIVCALFALIAWASYRQNRDYDVNQIGDLNIKNQSFVHPSLPDANR